MRLGTLLLALVCVTACKIDLDHAAKQQGSGGCMDGTSTACVAATGHQELSWIETNVFVPNCAHSGCHNGENTPQGKVNLSSGHSYASLVNVTSVVMPGAKLVVPGDPTTSYLEVLLGTQPGTIPSSVGTMPQSNGGQLLCCQKLDAIERWIMDGAMNN